MSAIEASLNLLRNIYQLAESKIEQHFQNLDSGAYLNPENSVLRISTITAEVAKQYNVKELDIRQPLMLYFQLRSDLDVRGGNITRTTDERDKTPMTPKECALKFYPSVSSVANAVIEKNFTEADESARMQGIPLNKVRLNLQDLCDQIAPMLAIKSYAVYHCLRRYIEEERRADLYIALGRQGGVMRRSPV